MITPGRLIVVEGLEGAGKSSVVAGIVSFLQSQHIPYIETREPGGTKIAECLRTLIKSGLEGELLLPRAELLCLYAARVQLIEQVIRPALQKGQWVVADRFELSTYAYQGGGRQLDKHMIDQLSHFCLQGLAPDQLFFLDILPEVGLARAAQRGAFDRIEQESSAFFERVYQAYQERLSQMSHVTRLDATLPLSALLPQIYEVLEGMDR